MITRHTPYLLLLPHIYRLGTRAPSPSMSSGPPRCWAPPPNKVLVPCPHPQRNSQSDGGGSCLIRKLWPGLIRPTRRERHGNRTNHNRASREGSLEEGRLPLRRPHSGSGTSAVRALALRSSSSGWQLLCVAPGKQIPPVGPSRAPSVPGRVTGARVQRPESCSLAASAPLPQPAAARRGPAHVLTPGPPRTTERLEVPCPSSRAFPWVGLRSGGGTAACVPQAPALRADSVPGLLRD